MIKYVTYSRLNKVNTVKDFEYQRGELDKFLSQEKVVIHGRNRYEEIATNARTPIIEFEKALAKCVKLGAFLLIPTFSKYESNVRLLQILIGSGLTVKFCDYPMINTHHLPAFLEKAEQKLEDTKKSTVEGLERARANGKALGRPVEGNTDTNAARASYGAKRDEHNNMLNTALEILESDHDEDLSFRVAAEEMTKMGFKTVQGNDIGRSTIVRLRENRKG